MDANAFSQQLKDHRTSRTRASVVSAVALALLVLLAWLFPLITTTDPSPSMEQEVLFSGTIDFGDLTEGSADINTTAESSPNANTNPQSPNRPNNPTPSANNVVTGTEVTGVQAEQNPTANATNTEPSDRVDDPLQFDGGGANDGESANTFGNAGTPGAPLTNGNGVTWGDGEYGARGRRLQNRLQIDYNVDEECRMQFELTVQPNGEVSDVRVLQTAFCPKMRNRSMEALRRLRFNSIVPNRTVQKIRCSLTFEQE
jgi:outer membrane biosynthesis protein TonB